jgi:hypothetical protein
MGRGEEVTRRRRILTCVGLVAAVATLAAGGARVAAALGSGPQAVRVAAVKNRTDSHHKLSPLQAQKLRLLRTADVSTRTGAVRLLRGLGLNPRGFVIQRGAHNYAGPTCPGKGWTCTKATRVLQENGDNRFQCTSGDSGSSSSAPFDCTVVQMNGGTAKCVEHTTTSTGVPITQTCSITQGANPSGKNRATVDQSADQSNKGTLCTQDVTQKAAVMQTNGGAGSNIASVEQEIEQTCDGNAGGGSITQHQEGHQYITNLTQAISSGSGGNNAEVDQSQDQDTHAEKGTVTQNQNTDDRSAPCGFIVPAANSCVVYAQDASTGNNTIDVDQQNNASERANGPASTVTQLQGCSSPTTKDCGIEQTGHQNTAPTAKNTAEVDQGGIYTEKAPPGANEQQDPRAGGYGSDQCCGSNDSFVLRQIENLKTSDPNAEQGQENDVFDSSTGNVDTKSKITINNGSSTVSCSGSGTCSYTQQCTTTNSEGVITDCTPSGTTTATTGGGLLRKR